MDYKEETKKVYDRHAERYNEFAKDFLKKHIIVDAELFLRNLNGKRILDLGSGPGRDSLFFKERGLDPLCIDLSSEMVKLCREKGLNAQVGDFENLEFEDSSFDGIWAYTSLLHLPKDNFKVVLDKISRMMKKEGIFYIGMRKGDSEGWISSDKFNGERRFISFYTDRELRNILSKWFNIIHSSKVELDGITYLNYLCKKLA